jgi:hypothetical protein
MSVEVLLVCRFLAGSVGRSTNQTSQGFFFLAVITRLKISNITDTTVFAGRIDGSGRLRMCVVALIAQNLGSNRQISCTEERKTAMSIFARTLVSLASDERVNSAGRQGSNPSGDRNRHW